jgi:hypothetical protein
MSAPRLTTSLEASAWLARATTAGGFGAVLHKGDAERGALLLLILERGEERFLVERLLQGNGGYGWERRPVVDSAATKQHLARAVAMDRDMWILELNVPSAERFIVEMTSPT